MPVRHRPAGKARLEIFRVFEHGMQRHVAAVAPAPDTDAIAVHIRKRFQISGAIALIGKLLRAEAVMNGLFKQVPASGRIRDYRAKK